MKVCTYCEHITVQHAPDIHPEDCYMEYVQSESRVHRPHKPVVIVFNYPASDIRES